MPAPADTGIALADASASPLLSRGSSRSPSPAPTDASSSGLGELAISGLPVNGKGRDKASSFSRAMRAAAPRPVRRCLRRCPNPISCRAVLRAVAVFVVGLAVLSFFISLPPTDEINKPPERVVTDFTCPAPAKEKNHAPAPASEPQRRPSDAILPLDTVPKMASNAAPPKYLILLSEKDERLDFVNNFHGSLLSSGAGRDSLVIVYSLDPSNAFLQLLNYYRNAHGMRIEVRRGDLSGGRKLELERFIWYREAIEEWSDVEMFMMCGGFLNRVWPAIGGHSESPCQPGVTEFPFIGPELDFLLTNYFRTSTSVEISLRLVLVPSLFRTPRFSHTSIHSSPLFQTTTSFSSGIPSSIIRPLSTEFLSPANGQRSPSAIALITANGSSAANLGGALEPWKV